MQIDALIPQHSFHVVSDIYTKDGLMEAKLCRKLMLRLGATDFLSARQTLVTDAHTAASLWPDMAVEPGFSITDFSSAEFEAVVQSVLEAPDALEDKQDTLRLILQTLDHQFRADYKPCLLATYTSALGKLLKWLVLQSMHMMHGTCPALLPCLHHLVAAAVSPVAPS